MGFSVLPSETLWEVVGVIIKYECDIKDDSIKKVLKKITNQIYKLLPLREEGGEWAKPLSMLIEELAGMSRLLFDQHETLFLLLCKMEGLFLLTQEEDFELYRRTIFDCLGLMNNIQQCLA